MNPGKVALVTGGARRIGRAIALKLASLGYDIALHYHSSIADAQATARDIKKLKVRCSLFRCDLTKDRQVKVLIANIKKQMPSLNLLINSASIFERSNLTLKDIKVLERDFTIHMKTPFILTSEFARLCPGGQIINILDTHITRNTTSHVAYLLSKKSLFELTKISAVELAPGTRVNSICPGIVLPPKSQRAGYLNRLAQNIPLKRKGTVDNITQTVEFLLNNDFVTGQTIFVDGGEHLL